MLKIYTEWRSPLGVIKEPPFSRRVRTLGHNLCDSDLSDEFWRNVYTIGGGRAFRQTYDTFLRETFRMLGVQDYRKIYNPKWFAAQNFYC